MAEIARRTIDELIARYSLEPDLDDVYVEGEWDRDLIEASLGDGTRRPSRAVYTIETVEISVSQLSEFQLTSGNKQRVIALAKKLETSMEGHFEYLCLVDRDLDHWFGDLESVRNLRWTEFTSLGVLFFQPTFVEMLHRDFFGIRSQTYSSNCFTALEEVLRSLFVLRLADRELDWRMSWIPLKKFLHIREGLINLNLPLYLDRLLLKNQRSGDKLIFQQALDRWRTQVTANDPRDCIRDHDLVELLAWYARKLGGVAETSSSAAIRRTFVVLASNNRQFAQEAWG